ncbi:eukaryotic translation initiation factor 2C 2 [Pyrenophora tritici-repentis]|uniref:Piwi multi-domain protein n=1 Tax=Pyrenophora tritici-repentis TaxID=45151 RepID=A0A2W1EQQ3_9PLEO|nr:Piwi multi-domain protein [Pyrenophora tritici-repentis]KAI1551023.1 eukaryotic translation initiation factor 2C 2 [Pyrenophora tritici-repentis]KAI1551751.1 eukaryotic translation initiation factor 2C 2 [Pyrenophora tritici-repentis]
MEADALALRSDKKSWATDYKSIWCGSGLQGPQQEESEWDTPEFPCTLSDGREHQGVYATVTSSGVLNDIENFHGEADINECTDHIRALNAHVAQRVREYNDRSGKSITQLGANKFYIDRAFNEMTSKGKSLGLRAVRGYYMSIRSGSKSPLLNVNVATTAFLPPILVSEFLRMFLNKRRYVETMLRGASVRLAYQRQEFKETIEEGISMNGDLQCTKFFQQFGLEAGKQKFFTILACDPDNRDSARTVNHADTGTTILKYFEDMRVEWPTKQGQDRYDLLCVNVGKRIGSFNPEKIDLEDMQQHTLDGAQWIPACLLEILPYQPMTGQMSPDHTAAMMMHALHYPAENAALIDKEGLGLLGLKEEDGRVKSEYLISIPSNSVNSTDEIQNDLSLELDNKLISLSAKKLSLPLLRYAKQSKSKNVSEYTASWNLQEAVFTNPKAFNDLHICKLQGSLQKLQKSTPENILNDFVLQLGTHGINVKVGYVGEQAQRETVEKVLKRWFPVCKVKDCTFFLLREKDFDIYAKIKRDGDFSGNHTICAVASRIKDRNEQDNRRSGPRWQHFSNLALKMNMKLGGDNHWLDENELEKVLGGKDKKQNTMILGADVIHPGSSSKIGAPSIACVVGTIDSRFMSYRGSMRLQAGGQEQIEDFNFRSMIKERLEVWKGHNKKLPTRIFFYRDGVSESQFVTISEQEIPQIKKAYAEAGGDDKKLGVCFLVVGKCHHTRFYAKNNKTSYLVSTKAGNFVNGNLKPELLVDHVVTAPKPINFFLQSHAAIKGTARSAHYYVLDDDTQIDVNNLQKLTLMLCYTFGRSTTGVSYAAPAYIADRLCERGRSYIRLWAEDRFAQPVFEYKKYYDSEGTQRKPTDEEMSKEKWDIIKELLRSGVWGKNYRDNTEDQNRPIRLNPWHPDLDEVE